MKAAPEGSSAQTIRRPPSSTMCSITPVVVHGDPSVAVIASRVSAAGVGPANDSSVIGSGTPIDSTITLKDVAPSSSDVTSSTSPASPTIVPTGIPKTRPPSSPPMEVRSRSPIRGGSPSSVRLRSIKPGGSPPSNVATAIP